MVASRASLSASVLSCATSCCFLLRVRGELQVILLCSVRERRNRVEPVRDASFSVMKF